MGLYWQLISEQQVGLIVTLCTCDRGIPGEKKQSEQYWPRFRHVAHHERVNVYTVSEKIAKGSEKRAFWVAGHGQEFRQVTHIQWKEWPDHGVPGSDLYPNLGKIVDRIVTAFKAGHRVLVHCSAGIGRTGTILALAHLRMHPGRRVFDVVKNLRRQRMGMVQTPEQYRLIHELAQA